MVAELSPLRKKLLEKNFKLMFFINAFSNIKMINIIWSLFFLHRGLTLSQVFFLSIIYATTTIFFEVPSSYLADRWGRKKTIIISTLLYCLYWVVFIGAHDFLVFSFGIFLYAASNAFRTGTDDALIYDTNRELSHSETSLKRLGKYYSGQHIFKIITPLVGAIFAAQLTEVQFVTLLVIDLLASTGALVAAIQLTEPKHTMDLEKQEAGILLDAVNLLRKNKLVMVAMFNRTLLFIATFIPWMYHHAFLVGRGVPLLALGIAWSILHATAFLASSHISHIFPRWSLAKRLNTLSTLVAVLAGLLVAALYFFPSSYLLLVLLMLFFKAENLRWPLFSEYYNAQSHSFNRATTLSLSNLLKSLLDFPLLFIAAWLVGINPEYPFVFVFIIAVVTIVFFKVKEYHTAT